MRQVTCPYCGDNQTQKRGRYPKQRYYCRSEKHPEGVSRYFYEGNASASMKVLVLDIETLPGIRYFWRLGEKNYDHDQIIRDPFVVSWAAKWLFHPNHVSRVLSVREAREANDKRIIQDIWGLLDDANVVIAHNGRRFDIPFLYSRFLIHNLPPPSPFRVLDTWEEASRRFSFTSNSLGHLSQVLGVTRKPRERFDLWDRCAKGNSSALREMQRYNILDVYVNEDVYVLLRPWISHPNLVMFSASEEQPVCGRCGGDDLELIGTYPAASGYASVYQTFRCGHCGGLVRHNRAHKTVKSRVV